MTSILDNMRPVGVPQSEADECTKTYIANVAYRGRVFGERGSASNHNVAGIEDHAALPGKEPLTKHG